MRGDSATGGDGGVILVAGVAIAPRAPGGGTPPIPEYVGDTYGAGFTVTGTAPFISPLALRLCVLPPVRLL
jgi:hypothetical protein